VRLFKLLQFQIKIVPKFLFILSFIFGEFASLQLLFEIFKFFGLIYRNLAMSSMTEDVAALRHKPPHPLRFLGKFQIQVFLVHARIALSIFNSLHSFIVNKLPSLKIMANIVFKRLQTFKVALFGLYELACELEPLGLFDGI
jgi:hypothetical protein